MATTSSQQHNPALKHLEVLFGDWEMELYASTLIIRP